MPTPAALASPAPGATLGGSSQSFQWNNSGASLYQWVGTSPGGFEVGYYPASGTAQTSIAVTGLPTDGSKLYVRLYSAINGAWQYRDFTYTAAGAGSAPAGVVPASITSPAGGSTLHGASQLFQWNDAGAQLYQSVGRQHGGSERLRLLPRRRHDIDHRDGDGAAHRRADRLRTALFGDRRRMAIPRFHLPLRSLEPRLLFSAPRVYSGAAEM